MNPAIKIENGKAEAVLPIDYAKAEFIIDLVCDAYNIGSAPIRLCLDFDKMVILKQVGMYLVKERTRLATDVIGLYFGKTHPTVNSSHKVIDGRRETDKQLNTLLNDLTQLVDDKFKL